MSDEKKLVEDISDREVFLECAVMYYREGRSYVKAKELSERLGVKTRSLSTTINQKDPDWPLEPTDFGKQSGRAYRITLEE